MFEKPNTLAIHFITLVKRIDFTLHFIFCFHLLEAQMQNNLGLGYAVLLVFVIIKLVIHLD